MPFSDIFLVLLAFQSLSLAGFLFLTKRGKSQSNIFLGLIIGTLGAHMTLNFLENSSGSDLTWITGTIGFVYGPLILYYVKSITYAGALKIRKFWIQLTPFLGALVWAKFGSNTNILGPLILLYFATYLVLAFLLIRRHQWIILNTKSDSQKYSLHWLLQFFRGVVLIFIIDLIRNLVVASRSAQWEEILFVGMIILLIAMLNIVVFKSINFSGSFLGNSDENESLLADNQKKYVHSAVTPEQLKTMGNSFDERMQSLQLFKNSELNLDDFAKDVGESPRLVSQVVNQVYNTNFSDWVNNFRVEYAKNLLMSTSKKDKNITQIFYESGFNSKSSFYAIFSKKTGSKPKELRD